MSFKSLALHGVAAVWHQEYIGGLARMISGKEDGRQKDVWTSAGK